MAMEQIDIHSMDGSAGARRQAIFVWLIRLLALVALAVAIYLLWSAGFKKTALAGCGPGSGCSLVLNSPWSRWLGLPVIVGAFGVYLTMLAATLYASPGALPHQQRGAWTILLLLAVLIAGAAAWFIFIQIWVLENICPYCMVEHALGLLVALLIVIGAPICRRRAGQVVDERGMGLARLLGVVLLGLLGTGVLIGGQIFFGRSYELRTGMGELKLDLKQVPVLGSVDAPHSITLLTDYTCPFCRMLHQTLDKARDRYGDQLAIAVLPVPLERKCNPAVPTTAKGHEGACELARIALAVWRADPSAFEPMDRWLFAGNAPRSPEEAIERASQLVGKEAIERALTDERINQMLGWNIELYSGLEGDSLPKMLMGDTYFTGTVTDDRIIFRSLERQLGIKPLVPGPSTQPTTTTTAPRLTTAPGA